MKCVLCTVGSLFFVVLIIFKFAFFASMVYPIIEEPKLIEHEYDVVIMGAGISGLLAATELYNAGIKNILIIEAQHYIGGRIKTIEFGINKQNKYSLNIGASHIYGLSENNSDSNPLYKLLNKYNIKYETDNNIMHSMPFSNHNHFLLKSYNKQLKNIDQLNNNHNHTNLFISDPLGLQGIILHLAANLIENGIDIILNEPIKSIQYNTNKIIIKTEGIQTNNNNMYRSKYGINTFSYGVLQDNSIKFEPNLPLWKYEAISKHEMINYITIYIQWPYAFWNNKIYYNNITTDEFIISINNLNNSKYFSGSNIWKIDIITTNINYKSIEKNIYKFIQKHLKIYFEYIPKPLDIFVNNWNNNKFIKGVWNVYNNEKIKNDKDHWKRIQSRVKNIFFASDGTNNLKYGTINGGFLEGIRCANDIIVCLKNGQLNWKCPTEYLEINENDMIINILRKFNDDYRVYFSCWVQFVIIRLCILGSMCILIIRKILKYWLKDSL